MSDVKRFNLPDVGEGLLEAEIVTWRVKVGDTVRVNDIVVEIETAKSLVELPSPHAGVVVELHHAEGEMVEVGNPIISIQAAGGAASTPEPTSVAVETAQPVTAEPAAVEAGLIGGPAPGGRTSVLVGYGPRTTEAKRRPRRAATPSEPAPAAAQASVQRAFAPHDALAPDLSPDDPALATPALLADPTAGEDTTSTVPPRALAKPPVRMLAKELGVDLAAVTPSGPGGTVSRDDVARHADLGPPAQPELHSGETRTPVRGVRKVMAQAMVASAFTAPHVTEWVTVDATRTMSMVERLRRDRAFADVKVSPLLVVARAVCLAFRRTPELNASWDEANQEVVTKHHVNLGIAAATPRGLLVPNVKQAQQLSLHELASALGELTDRARAGTTSPGEQAGGTFTITNVGIFGVDGGTPILNPGESGILCIGAIRKQPWVVRGNKIKPRWVVTLSLSFDHRVADGEQASRFLSDVSGIVSEPANALLF